MEEVRLLVQEEGREARNLIAFHVSMDTPGSKLSKKPPKFSTASSTALKIARRVPCRGQASRLRSASAGRDKRSELQARYWALLFGNLQRAIGEIYTTVESHESLSECQEVILVLENYTRDFKALCEWFRLKWEYDNTPPPQRPQSLAWEVRKTDFVRPESRKASSLKSSPSVSGKNSPTVSGRTTPTGKHSPNVATGKTSPASGKLSPRIQATSPKTNQEFFGAKSKVGTRLSDIKETAKDDTNIKETNKLKEILKIDTTSVNDTKTDIKKAVDNVVSKTIETKVNENKTKKLTPKELTPQAKCTIETLNKMETEFMKTQNDLKVKPKISPDKPKLTLEKPKVTPDKPKLSPDKPKIDVSVKETVKPDSNKSDVKTAVKPAYSQAAAKPKQVTPAAKPDLKPRFSTLTRSKTASEIRPSNPRANQNRATSLKQRSNVKCSYPFNLTTGRAPLFDSPPPARNPRCVPRNPRPNLDRSNSKPGVAKGSLKNEPNSALTRIESTESVRTLVPDEVNSNNEENEGWLTVKSRRFSRCETKKGKNLWSNRFNQPSATTSLPTLSINQAARHVSLEETQAQATDATSKGNPIIRQKSDMTGLKTRSRVRKNKGENKCEMSTEPTRLHSSLESLLPIGLSRSQESTDPSTSPPEFKPEFIEDEHRLLRNLERFETSDPVEMSEIAEISNEIEENERKMSLALDFQSDFDQQKLIEEENSLNRQIMELQKINSDCEFDIETDDTETDAEIPCSEDDTRTVIMNVEFTSEDLNELVTQSSLENRYEPALANMSWADRMDTLAKLEALVARYPGRAQQLHAKLSQGIRRRGSLQETLKRCIIKQDRAERQRQELQRERTEKLHQLLTRVEDVKTAKNQLIDEKRLRMEQRLQKAAENRDQHLKDRVRKAHDEEEKLKEIAFIKQLEAENRRHDFLVQCKTRTQRLRQIRRDRLIRLEQKAEHSLAVGARRSALEAARIQRVTCLLEKSSRRANRLKEQNELKAKEKRLQAESLRTRLSAMAAAAEVHTESLRNKIQNKQEESEARHISHLDAVRSRAVRPTTINENQESLAKEENLIEDQIETSSKEKLKAHRKRMRKIKQKLLLGGELYETHHRPPDLALLAKYKSYKPLCQIYKMIQPLLTDEIPEAKTTPTKKKKKKNASGGGDDKSSSDVAIVSADGDKSSGDVVRSDKENDGGRNTDDKMPKKKQQQQQQQRHNSVSSGVSDVSSLRIFDDKMKHVMALELNASSLDRALNELARVFDKNLAEHNSQQTAQLFRILSGLLMLASEKSHCDISLKSLLTTLNILKTMFIFTHIGSMYYLFTNGPVYMTQLLITFMAKETKLEKEKEIINILFECLTFIMDSLSRMTKQAVEGRLDRLSKHICNLTSQCLEKVTKNNSIKGKSDEVKSDKSKSDNSGKVNGECIDLESEDNVTIFDLRKRGHLLISFILCAPFNMDSGSPLVDKLLTSIYKVCAISAIDPVKDSSERQSAVASLKSSCSPNGGSISSRTCFLLSEASVSQQKNDFGELLASLRALAELDHQLLKECLGSGVEFRAAASKLLIAHAPSDRESNGNMQETESKLSAVNEVSEATEEMLLDLIATIGYYAIGDEKCNWVPRALSSLPASWMCGVRGHTVNCTLAALAHTDDVSQEMLEEFLESEEAKDLKMVKLIKETRAKKGETTAK